MALKFNVFTGNFDLTGSGGGGGGSSVITAAVETFADLPETLGTPPIDAVFLVREASGAFNPFATRRFAGLYIRSDNTGVRADDWTFLGAYPDLFLDGNFLLANTATPSKQAAFDLSAIASATTRTLTVPDQDGTLALTSDITGGGSKTYATFTATDNQPTATDFATLDTRNSIAVLDYDDAATESAVFVGVMPEAAALGSGLIVRLIFTATTATSGDVRWSVDFERGNTDLDSDSFDTAVAATVAVDATSGIPAVGSLTVTTIDGITAGDLYRLRVQRIGGDGADTASGDAELIAVEVRSAA